MNFITLKSAGSITEQMICLDNIIYIEPTPKHITSATRIHFVNGQYVDVGQTYTSIKEKMIDYFKKGR